MIINTLRIHERVTALVLTLSVFLGGCSLMFPHRADLPALSDDQARAQVVDAATQITSSVNLPDMYGNFKFGSCNDQAEAPYRGVVEMSFTPPSDADAYFDHIAATMIAHGWNNGPPPGLHPYGRVINKNGVMAIMSAGPSVGWARIQVYGECRNMTDHRSDGKTNWDKVTDQLRSG
ncbi:hypothetical protein [Mycobacterium simiae]|nr:hypothetical protein [Mycobacterium simiae]